MLAHAPGFAPEAAGWNQYLEAAEPVGPHLVITEQSLGEPQRATGRGPHWGGGGLSL